MTKNLTIKLELDGEIVRKYLNADPRWMVPFIESLREEINNKLIEALKEFEND